MNLIKIKERIEKLESEMKRDRLENTAKRAREAENVRENLRAKINNNKKLIAIHTKDEYSHLRKVNSVACFDFFTGSRTSVPFMYTIREGFEIPSEISKLFIIEKRGEYFVYYYNAEASFKEYNSKKEELLKYFHDWRVENFLKGVKQFENFGFKTIDEFNEFQKMLDSVNIEETKLDPIKSLEAKLVGQKGIGIDFFPTPIKICERMCELAKLNQDYKVLEPSAGNGNLCDTINSFGVPKNNIHACEISYQLKELLRLKGYNVIVDDFMDLSETKKYDRIIMNPPFCADTEHIRKAFNHLVEGGRLVSIISVSAMNNNTKKYLDFREWMEEHCLHKEVLETGTFNDNKLLNKTMVASCLIVLEKNY